MSNEIKIIDLGKLSKPATVLIEKVSSAIGIAYEPTRIRRKAQAQIDAEKIKALGRLEIGALEQRALERLVFQEARKQENIEQITAQAADMLPEDAKVADLNEDWVAHFFKQCDTVSDKEMQSLWSRLLSGEAAKPGTFSKRTVDFVSSIDKRDAEIFTNLSKFVWVVGGPQPLIYDLNHQLYKQHGVTFDTMKHLDAIGLVSFESLSGYMVTKLPKKVMTVYYGMPLIIEFPNEQDNTIQTGHVLLTATGRELVSICGSSSSDEFFQYMLGKWIAEGLILSTPVKEI